MRNKTKLLQLNFGSFSFQNDLVRSCFSHFDHREACFNALLCGVQNLVVYG